MGDEPKFSEKWDFRRKENNFDDSSSDDPDSNSTRNPIIPKPNLVLDSNQLENGSKIVTRKQPAKTRARRSKKDESKPEKAKQQRGRKPKPVCEEENKKKEETVMPTDDVGMFMKTLIDDLTASRESLMDWMKTELYGPNQNVASQPPVKKRAVDASKLDDISQEMNKPKEIAENSGYQVPELDCTTRPLDSYLKSCQDMSKSKGIAQNGGDYVQELECSAGPLDSYLRSSQELNKPKEIAQNGGDQVQELDCNAGPLNRFLKSGQDGLGRNYFQQQQEGQEGIVAQTEMENEKNETVMNQKSIVLAIKAPNLSERQKKTREANTIKNRSSMVERTESETHKDHNFAIPYVPKLSSLPSLQSFPVAPSLFPSSSQGIMSFASNNNFQLRQPSVVSQISDLSEFQTGFTGGQGFGNSMFNNNGYLSGFPPAFQPNPIAGSYNFPAQVNPATSLQQRGNNNMFGGLRVGGGAIRFSDGRFPESEVGNGINSLSDYRTSSGR
ncbi:unnamed protein product [Arabis nemorensis]|uniref:Uncharacterized protein n=1 Tax=Arabis nemorensis TaxID=586526 RepID=A0A565C750_9BRAS|nr:unnamed protein product [Arabis nemorensis]